MKKQRKSPTPNPGRNVLARLRKYFPQVTQIREATAGINIAVEEQDSKKGRKKDPMSCALVQACLRQKIADGAVIGLANSYLIKGNVATRYKTSTSIGREITSFDRHQDFAPGKDYRLSPISLQSTLAASSKQGCERYAKKQRAKRDRERWLKRKKQGGPWDDKQARPPLAVHRTGFVRQLKAL